MDAGSSNARKRWSNVREINRLRDEEQSESAKASKKALAKQKAQVVERHFGEATFGKGSRGGTRRPTLIPGRVRRVALGLDTAQDEEDVALSREEWQAKAQSELVAKGFFEGDVYGEEVAAARKKKEEKAEEEEKKRAAKQNKIGWWTRRWGASIKEGTQVRHIKRGLGRVVAISPDNDDRVHVKFVSGEKHRYYEKSWAKFRVILDDSGKESGPSAGPLPPAPRTSNSSPSLLSTITKKKVPKKAQKKKSSARQRHERLSITTVDTDSEVMTQGLRMTSDDRSLRRARSLLQVGLQAYVS
jgi:hypothetical protein